MGEHVGQHKKATTGSFSISTLKQPTRGFDLNSPGASSQATTDVQLKNALGHDISRISLRPQTKLTVNQPGDVYEQEADKVAQQVMQRMSEPAGNQQSIQREELLEEEEELQMKSLAGSDISLQREELPEEEEELQMKSLAGSNISLQREELPEEEEELQMKSLSASPQAVTGMQPLTHDISRMSLRLQTRLTVNQPGDIYEQEADRVAQQVMQRMSEPGNRQSIQREALPEEEDQLQMKSLVDSITPVVQRKGGGGIAATSELETSIQQARQGGQPLSDDIRQPMEVAFGADFGGVKIHTDSQSDQLNQSVQARAFTTGQDIFFRQGEYAPESNGGKELLAHELTHVVQQNGGAVQPKTLSNETVKKNKIQTKSLLTSPADFQPAIQRRENPQQKTEQDKQGQEQVGLKPDTEKPQEQRQDSANRNVAVASPPATGAGAAADSSGTPPANQNNKNSQKQTHTEQPAEPKAKQANPEHGEMQGQAAAGKAGVGTAPSAGKGLGSAEAGGEKAPASASDDPGFQAVVGTTKEVAAEQKKHEPAKNKAQEAQGAAEPPSNEVGSKAQANQVGEMGQAETPAFDATAFKVKLMERIADMAPKTLEEADEFKNNNKLDSVKGDLSGKVDEQQKASQQPLEEKAKETPDTSGIESKKVTPLPQTNSGTPPSDIDAKKAAPKSKGKSQVEAPLQEESKKLDQQMVEANVTEEQLANSNEPEFQAALAAKKDAQTNATQAPQQYRQQEQNLLTNAQATAQATAQQQLQAMHGTRTQQLGQVGNQQVGAKGKDEQARAKVAGDINKIYDKTKGIVEKTLSDLDSQVQQEFDGGAAEAKKVFEDYVDQRMKAYKDDRYSGVIGKGKWLKDKLLGMPSEVNAFYQEGRQLYINRMDGVINKVVAIISKGLTQAKAEITKGKQEIQNYVDQLPQDLKAVGQQAAADIESKFDALEQSVKDKENELIETLAQKYQENLEAVDARIDEMKAANQGLVQKAFDGVVGVIKTIIELTKMLMGVLARVAGVVEQILKDPIGFLGNLIQALKQGFLNFMNGIGKHLQHGLIGWLTGTIAEAGFEMPEKFDLKGIFSLVSQVLGFTYQVIRAQAVKRLGEKKVGYLEQKFEIFQILAGEGIAGIWQFVQDKMGDLNELVIEPIKNFVIEKVVIAGIEWVISLLTPASAFVKAAKAIYQIISFFIERAQQIGDLINAILDAVSAIASGAIDQAVKGVENALAKSLPVVISFLASLLGLGGIAGKVQAIFQKLRSPVEKAVDWIIDKGAKAANKVGNKFNDSKAGKKFHAVKDSAKEKYKAGKQWVEDKKETGKQWAEDKKQASKQWLEDKKHNSKYGKPDERSPKQKQDDLDKGLAEAHELIKDDNTSSKAVKKGLASIKSKYQMASLELVVKSQHDAKETVYVKGKVNPTGKTGDEEILGDPENLNEKSVEVLVREADTDWKKVKAKYLADPSTMRKIIAFREQEVNGITLQVKARLSDDRLKAIALGSKDLTSDLDITFDASGNQSLEIKAVKLFNQIFRQRWGKESGTVFDTNVYTTGHMPVGEGKEQKEQDKKETEWQMTQGGKNSSQEIQDIMSLLKIRRFLSDAKWKEYKHNTVNGIKKQDQRLKMIGRFTEVDSLYKQTNIQMERKIDELNQGVKNLNLSIKDRVKQIKKRNSDAEMEASNRLYEEYLEKVDRIFQELQQIKQEVTEAGVRSKKQSQKLDKLTLELQRSRSMALVFANEAYHTGGAVEHVVLNQQMKLDISITNQQYLQSINEQTGFAVEQINHSQNVGTALWKSAKYVDRLCDAIAKIDIQNFKRPQEQEKLSQLAKTLLQIKKAQGDYQNLTTDEERSQAAKKVGRANGYTSREAWLQAVLNLNQEVNQEIRSKMPKKTNKTNQDRN
ncbi:eCIS core domain-containing protein [Nostoc sp. UHCC 0252]|uniref:eCIS core domain-containing protein n=1 Tax=Nostoc sp. UHCC 0252 TaxID=3110241 RepID=UPI002B1F2D46|nr:DUF4157 domain-containing protein [Nostoc sp. UHCC 0252]MEA5605363.1 DUF4157 domain-containing protein [Nostoc sp. UHCC 0252]